VGSSAHCCISGISAGPSPLLLAGHQTPAANADSEKF
jgi:hypothetical protein